jgi:hypothetical protein
MYKEWRGKVSHYITNSLTLHSQGKTFNSHPWKGYNLWPRPSLRLDFKETTMEKMLKGSLLGREEVF